MIRSPGFILFLAGIAASVGSAYFVLIPAADDPPNREWYFVLCACPWFLLSWLLAEIGTLAENARRKIDQLSSPYLKAEEIGELEERELTRVGPAVKRRIIYSIIMFILGILAPRVLL